MQFKEIKTMKAPAPVGPYSQALEHNGIIFCSGQIALDPETGVMVGKTPGEQAEKLLTNLENVLKEAGLSFKNIIKTVIFLTDMSAFAEVNAVYEKRMNGHRPARSTVAAAALPKGALVEIECIAIRS